MKKGLLLVLMVVTAASVSQEESTQESIASRLAQHVIMRGKFVQIREVEGIPQGLRSQGHYVFWRDHGIYWATQLPQQRAITYRNDKTLLWSNEHSEPQEVNSSADKHLRRILMTIFSFDTQQLNEQFDQQWEVESTGWTLLLVPKQSTTKRFLQEIALRGKTDIEGLSVVHTNGEILTIDFQDSQVQATMELESCTTYFAYSHSECEQMLHATQP